MFLKLRSVIIVIGWATSAHHVKARLDACSAAGTGMSVIQIPVPEGIQY